MRRIIFVTLTIFAVLFTGLVSYETWRVLDARAKTPELMASALAKVDPTVDRISQKQIDMLLAVDDPTFWTNDGTDFYTPGAGWTTLTQGLGKNVYFERFTPGFQKIELILIAKFALTARATKEEILRASLSRMYLSHDDKGQIFGFPEAARRWYGREIDQLTDREYLSLVAMTPAPNALDPRRHPKENAERVARIERLLAKQCTPDGVFDVELEGCKI